MAAKMTKAERAKFLAEAHVAILSLREEARGPLAVPVFYDVCGDGLLWFLIDRKLREGNQLAVGTRISLVVQRSERPYRYVSVEGPIKNITTAAGRDLSRQLGIRYLAGGSPELYDDQWYARPDTAGSVKVTMQVERWLTADYGKDN